MQLKIYQESVIKDLLSLIKNKVNKIKLKIQRFLFSITKKLPESYIIPNPYNIPVHNQGDKNNCTSHAFASMMEYHLSDKLKERAIIDIDDLWEKQKKFGTATEEDGDFLEGPIIIATKYGVRFSAESGRRGTFFLSGKTEKKRGMTFLLGGRIEFD
ncbi:MAG: hypothetical protein ACKKMV_02995 [Candidatus Nealsonbacteria bacterium]